MVFIDIEKACNWVPKEAMLLVLEKNRVPLKYIKLIKKMSNDVVISMRTSGGITK